MNYSDYKFVVVVMFDGSDPAVDEIRGVFDSEEAAEKYARENDFCRRNRCEVAQLYFVN